MHHRLFNLYVACLLWGGLWEHSTTGFYNWRDGTAVARENVMGFVHVNSLFSELYNGRAICAVNGGNGLCCDAERVNS